MEPVKALALLITCLASAMLVNGCPQGELTPVEVVLNEDACCICFMAVSSRDFAAQTVSPDGTVEYYDDIGCLVERAQHGGLPEGSLSFVVDLTGADWINSQTADYFWSADLPTPMSYGLAAFTDAAAANAKFQEFSGRVVDWDTLVKEFDPGV